MTRELTDAEVKAILDGANVQVEILDNAGLILRLHLPPGNAPGLVYGGTVLINATLSGMLVFKWEGSSERRDALGEETQGR